jgi:hypothetical protein
MKYNMYHKRPMKAQNARPIRMPDSPKVAEGGRSKRPLCQELATAGHADRGTILAGATVSSLGPQRIIAQISLSYLYRGTAS